MARIEVDPNYSAPTFSRATAATDLFKKEDVQGLAAAFSGHTHDNAGKGLAVVPLTAGQVPNGLITSAMIQDATIVGTDITGALSLTGTLVVPGNCLIGGVLTTNTNVTINGQLNTGGNIVVQGNTVYFTPTASQYFNWDGSRFFLSAQLAVNGHIFCGSNVLYNVNGSQFIQWGSSATAQILLCGPVRVYNASNGADADLQARNTSLYQLGINGAAVGAGGYVIICPNAAGANQGSCAAFAWIVWSSVDHATEYGLPIAPISDPIGKLLSVDPVYYDHTNFDAETGQPVRSETGGIVASTQYGMSPSQLKNVLPELVGEDDQGIDYARLSVVLWAVCQDQETRLAALEAAAPAGAA